MSIFKDRTVIINLVTAVKLFFAAWKAAKEVHRLWKDVESEPPVLASYKSDDGAEIRVSLRNQDFDSSEDRFI